MIPIMRYLLIHSATQRYGTKTQNDEGQWSFASSRSLTHVRFEPSNKLVKTNDNNEAQLSAIMFYDCVNSEPSGATFTLGDTIEWGDTAYEVVGGTKPIYAGTNAHHFELELV